MVTLKIGGKYKDRRGRIWEIATKEKIESTPHSYNDIFIEIGEGRREFLGMLLNSDGKIVEWQDYYQGGMSDESKEYVNDVWELVKEVAEVNLNLEVGKVYVDEDGDLVKIIASSTNGEWFFGEILSGNALGQGYTYESDGSMEDGGSNLVKEYQKPLEAIAYISKESLPLDDFLYPSLFSEREVVGCGGSFNDYIKVKITEVIEDEV